MNLSFVQHCDGVMEVTNMSLYTYLSLAVGTLIFFVFVSFSSRNSNQSGTQPINQRTLFVAAIALILGLLLYLHVQFKIQQSNLAMSNWRKGLQQMKLHDYATAQKYFESAVKYDPNSPVYQFELAESKKAGKY